MWQRKKEQEHEDSFKANQISKRTNFILELIMGVLALCTALPVVLVVIISFSSEQSIFEKGYSFIPSEFSFKGYEFFLKLGDYGCWNSDQLNGHGIICVCHFKIRLPVSETVDLSDALYDAF